MKEIINKVKKILIANIFLLLPVGGYGLGKVLKGNLVSLTLSYIQYTHNTMKGKNKHGFLGKINILKNNKVIKTICKQLKYHKIISKRINKQFLD